MVECSPVDINGQKMDSSRFYLLIKVDFTTRRIGVRVCDKHNVDIEDFWGYQCQDLYSAILIDPRSKEWFTDMTHIAYLGKELKKAEIALATGYGYYQE